MAWFGYFCEAWRKCMTFSGRMSRKAFWGFAFFQAYLVLSVFLFFYIRGIYSSMMVECYFDGVCFAGVARAVLRAAALILLGFFSAAACVRRLHDSGHSGRYVLVGALPFVLLAAGNVFYTLCCGLFLLDDMGFGILFLVHDVLYFVLVPLGIMGAITLTLLLAQAGTRGDNAHGPIPK